MSNGFYTGMPRNGHLESKTSHCVALVKDKYFQSCFAFRPPRKECQLAVFVTFVNCQVDVSFSKKRVDFHLKHVLTPENLQKNMTGES